VGGGRERGGREGGGGSGREGGRKGGWNGRREGGMEEGREGGWKGGREGGKEGLDRPKNGWIGSKQSGYNIFSPIQHQSEWKTPQTDPQSLRPENQTGSAG